VPTLSCLARALSSRTCIHYIKSTLFDFARPKRCVAPEPVRMHIYLLEKKYREAMDPIASFVSDDRSCEITRMRRRINKPQIIWYSHKLFGTVTN
jgi:hypothetical protein